VIYTPPLPSVLKCYFALLVERHYLFNSGMDSELHLGFFSNTKMSQPYFVIEKKTKGVEENVF